MITKKLEMKYIFLKGYSLSPSVWTILIALISKKLSLAHIVVIQICDKFEKEG